MKKNRKKSLKAILIYLLVIIMLSVGAYSYKKLNIYLQEKKSSFELEDIQISGNNILSDKDILNFIGLEKDSKLLQVKAVEVVTKIKQSPFVKSASAVHSLPSTLRIKVNERQPIAFIYGKGLNLIDSEGFILPFPDKNFRWNLPLISGINENLGKQGDYTVSTNALKMVEIAIYIQLLEMPFREMVSEIVYNGDNDINIKLIKSDGSIRITFSEYKKQLFLAAKYLKNYFDFKNLDKLDYVDLRFAGQLILKEAKG